MNIKLDGNIKVNGDLIEFDNLDIDIDEEEVSYDDIFAEYGYPEDEYDEYEDDFYDECNCEECSDYINADDFYNSYTTILMSAGRDEEFIKEVLEDIVNKIQGS